MGVSTGLLSVDEQVRYPAADTRVSINDEHLAFRGALETAIADPGSALSADCRPHPTKQPFDRSSPAAAGMLTMGQRATAWQPRPADDRPQHTRCYQDANHVRRADAAGSLISPWTTQPQLVTQRTMRRSQPPINHLHHEVTGQSNIGVTCGDQHCHAFITKPVPTRR